MVRKKLKANHEAYCRHLVGLLQANRIDEFAQDVLSGITGKVRVPIAIILQKTGLSLAGLARILAKGGVGFRKVQVDCPDSDPYKPALLAALHYEKSMSVTPIMPIPREDLYPYVLSRRFVNEVAHA